MEAASSSGQQGLLEGWVQGLRPCCQYRVRSPSPEMRCIDGGELGGRLESRGWLHWRNTSGAVMQVSGEWKGPSEKRRGSILFLRSRTKPGFT